MTRRSLLSLTAAALSRNSIQTAEALLRAAAQQAQPKSSVLYVKQDKFEYLQAFGDATSDSRFLIASITKPMSAAAVMSLVDKGKVKLDDPVAKFLPGLPPAMLLRHLLTHTSGLPDMLPDNTALRKRHAPLDEYTRLALTTPLLFAPGEKWSYSSTGILLATEIAHRVDGRSFPQILQNEIFDPLAMRHTTLGLGSLTLNQVVRSQTEYAPADLGNTRDTADWDWNSPYWRGLGAPWGGAHSAARDIAAFMSAFLHRPNWARSIQNQNPPHLPPYGLGWALGARLGKTLSPQTFGHGGSTGTLCWADPASGKQFVLLTSLPDVVARKKIIEPVSEAIAAA